MVISIARLFFLIILVAISFFGFYIIRASVSPNGACRANLRHSNTPVLEQQKQQQQPPRKHTDEVAPHYPNEGDHVHANGVKEPDWPMEDQPHRELPHVPGQTEDDLTSPEPLQATPPTVFYDSPEATDPMNKHAYMNATFGSNLRHPEQMIESYPNRSMQNALDAGIASKESASTGFRAARYSEEMIQNGGVMQDGILANDIHNSGSGFGLGYSLL